MTNAGLKWVKSRFSEAGAHPCCVEVAEDGELVRIRESEDPTAEIIVPRGDVIMFRDAVKSGDVTDMGGFDPSDGSDDMVILRYRGQQIRTPKVNYALFVAGVIAGDFDYIEPAAGVTA